AATIDNALRYTLESGVHTGDFGDKNTPAANTTEFADAIIENFGKRPKQGAVDYTGNNKPYQPAAAIDQHPMLESTLQKSEAIVGADLFVQCNQQPSALAALCQQAAGDLFKLIIISNRGTQVWPTGSVYTNLVNQYRVRFESIDGGSLQQADIIALYERVSHLVKVCSVELLHQWGDQKAYSLAQGQ
ncbi:MAG: hypothetical protein ACKOC7_05125, partial [Sphingomonadales bacterium]